MDRVSIGVPTYIIYKHHVCREISNANTIKQYFSLKRYENKLPCRFRPFRSGVYVFPVSGYPLFTVIYCCCVPRRAHRTERHYILRLYIDALYLNNASSSPTSSYLVFTVACMSKVLKFTAHIKFFNQTQTVTFSISVFYIPTIL